MNEAENRDYPYAVCKVKGYRHTLPKLLGLLGIFFAALIIGTVYSVKEAVSTQGFIITWVVGGILIAASICLVAYEKTATAKMKNKDCVILFEDGVTVFVDKPRSSKGYRHFDFDQIQDYGFINILQSSSGSGETRLLLNGKQQSADTYLEYRLLNYGYLRLTTKDGGYYNVPVGDIKTVRDFFKNHTQIEEYVYIRIAGVHDNIIIPLK